MRNYSIDTFRFFVAFAVVAIHTQPFKLLEGCINESLYLIIRVSSSFAALSFLLLLGICFIKELAR